MRYPKWFARRRVRVWDRRLEIYRREWNKAITSSDEHQHPEAYNAVTVDQFWERLVTRALTKRTLWRKRAGVRKLSAAPDRPEPKLPDPFRHERDWRNH